jgi:hypothetical protein
MMFAHVAGLPFEEWLAPLMVTGSGIAVGLRAALRRLRPPKAASPQQSDAGGSHPVR